MNKRPAINNLVAKHAAKFNKAAVHRNKKKDYQRKARTGSYAVA